MNSGFVFIPRSVVSKRSAGRRLRLHRHVSWFVVASTGVVSEQARQVAASSESRAPNKNVQVDRGRKSLPLGSARATASLATQLLRSTRKSCTNGSENPS